MAYNYTKIGSENLYCGEDGDVCFLCGNGLNGRDCLTQADFLICLEDCQGGND